jgi:hypothetical protein
VGSIYLRLKSTSTMATILEVREEIKALKQEIVALNKKIVASETKLEKLNQQKNEHGLSTAAKKEIGDEITFIRSDILLDKQLITAKEQRIVLEKRQIAAKEQKEAWNGETSPFPDRTFPVPDFLTECMHSTFPLKSVCYRISLPQLWLQLFGRPSRRSQACSSAGPSSSQPTTPDSPTPCFCSSTSLRPASPSRTDLLASSSTWYPAPGVEMRPMRTTKGKELKML